MTDRPSDADAQAVLDDLDAEMYRNTHAQPRKAHLFAPADLAEGGASTDALADDLTTSVCGLAQSYGPFAPVSFDQAEADAYETLCGSCVNIWRGRREAGEENDPGIEEGDA